MTGPSHSNDDRRVSTSPDRSAGQRDSRGTPVPERAGDENKVMIEEIRAGEQWLASVDSAASDPPSATHLKLRTRLAAHERWLAVFSHPVPTVATVAATKRATRQALEGATPLHHGGVSSPSAAVLYRLIGPLSIAAAIALVVGAAFLSHPERAGALPASTAVDLFVQATPIAWDTESELRRVEADLVDVEGMVLSGFSEDAFATDEYSFEQIGRELERIADETDGATGVS